MFSYVNKPVNLPQISPSLIEIKNEKLLPQGGYSFRWTYKMIGSPMAGKAEYTDISPDFWFYRKIQGVVDSLITWTFRSQRHADAGDANG
jgi:outer membrane protein assembly factor BamA